MTRVSGGSVVATYTYYFNGLRKSKTAAGVTTNYDWDASGNLVKESDSNGNTTCYYYDDKGNPVGFNKNSVTYIYHTDLRGDIVAITDENGNTQEQYNYDPWGNQIASSGTISQPYLYAGYYYDSETGLYYLKNRYYSPTLGRFLTKDGYGNNINLKNPQTLNLYTYCGNNPVSNVDPSGEFTLTWEDVITGAETVASDAASIAAKATGVVSGVILDILLNPTPTSDQDWDPDYYEASKIGGDTKVKDILKNKKGSIKNAPLDEGSPSWDDIQDMSLDEITKNAKQGKPGYKTIRKLLTDSRFDR